jgi:hypothetical protein
VDLRQIASQFLRVSVPRRTNNTNRSVFLALHLSMMGCDGKHVFVAFRPYSPKIAEQFHVRQMG